MYKGKYHIITGIVCLIISIVLPTFIHHYYFLIEPWKEALFSTHALLALATYGLFAMLGMLLLLFIVISLHELGGYMIRLMDNDDEHHIHG